MPLSSQRRAIAEIEDDYLEYVTLGHREALRRSASRPIATPAVPEDEEADYAELVVSVAPEARAAEHSVSQARAPQPQRKTAPRLLATFSSIEEDFFAAGEALSELPDDAAEDFADLDLAATRRPLRLSLWRRVLG